MPEQIAVGDIATLRRGTTYKGSLLGQPGPILLGLGTIERNGGFRAEKLQQYGGESHPSILLKSGDLFVSLKDVTHSGDLLGAAARMPDNVSIGRLTQDTVGVTIINDFITTDYLYWMLRTPEYRSYCREHATGTTNLGLPRSDFLAYSFPLPDEHRKATVNLLNALDHKMSVNRRAAATADLLVRSIYKRESFFSATTRSLGSIVDQVRQPVNPHEINTATSYVGLEHMPRRHMWLENLGTADSVSSAKSKFQQGDVLFGRLRPYFHKVVSAPVGGICSTDVIVCRAVEPAMSGLVLAAMSSDKVIERCAAASEGTRMPRTSWADLQAIEVPWPDRDVAIKMSAAIHNIQLRVEAGLKENQTLAALRDTLLPQLISGKLRVKDAEKDVEEVL